MFTVFRLLFRFDYISLEYEDNFYIDAYTLNNFSADFFQE